MTSYWPSGLDLTDTATPLEILNEAQREWTDHSAGVLTLVIQHAESANENRMLIVHAMHVPSRRTVTLFSVVHRLNAPYPARIQPQGNELPDILRKSYYRPGLLDTTAMAVASGVAIGGQVTNKWVCETPAEFRTQLREVFNQGTLKSEIMGLLSGSQRYIGSESVMEADESSTDDAPTDEFPSDESR